MRALGAQRSEGRAVDKRVRLEADKVEGREPRAIVPGRAIG